MTWETLLIKALTQLTAWEEIFLLAHMVASLETLEKNLLQLWSKIIWQAFGYKVIDHLISIFQVCRHILRKI